ncbi:heat shock factor protein 1 isoform X2 [Lepisosteus oculatus]
MASFVRQLNMYGFHKMAHADAGLPRDREESVEFRHPHFQCGQLHLLDRIKRKVSISRGGEEGRMKQQQEFSQILLDIRQVQCCQEVADSKLLAIKRENESLWNEVDSLRQKYQQQHKVIRKIIHFIASMAQSKGITGRKRKLPLMIDNSGLSHSHPKYSRPITMDSSQETSVFHGIPLGSKTLGPFENGSVYPNGMVISDITDLLEQREADLCQGSSPGGSSPLHVSHRPLLTEAIVLEGLDSTPLSPLNPVDLCSALLDDCMPGGPEESASERAELTDALDAIDSSQPQVPSSPDASRPSLDLLRELFSPTSFLSSAYLDAEEDQLLKRCSESAEEDRGHSRPQKIKAEMVQYGAPQEGCEEEDILPTLLQLAQEVSNTGPCPGELTPGPAPPAPGLACS